MDYRAPINLPDIEVEFEKKLSEDLLQELEAISQLSDVDLWQIAESNLNADKVAMYDMLLEQHRENKLTVVEQMMLQQLREETDTLALRKAHAYLVLKSRGCQLPTLQEISQQIGRNQKC